MDAFVMDLAIRGAGVLTATIAGALLARRASAATRHLVWAGGAAALVSVPFLARVLPEVGIPLLPAPSAAPAAWGPAPSSGSTWLFWTWIAGVALVGLTVVVGRSRVWWLARTSHRLTGGPLRALATRLCGEIGLSRRIELRVVDRPIMPMMWGVVRPTILLPAAIEEWPEERQRHVLLHELCHVQRNDYAVQVVGRIACALHWFNPLAWIAARRLRDERERACDDHVLGTGTSPCDYAEDLLEVARTLRSTPVHVTAIGMARLSSFGERLAALLDESRPRSRVTRKSAAASMIAAACVVAPLAAVQPEASDGKRPETWAVEAVEVVASGEHAAREEARRRIDSVRRAEERLTGRSGARGASEVGRRTVLTVAAPPIDVVVGGPPATSTGDEQCHHDHETKSDPVHERTPAAEARLATSARDAANHQ